MTTIKRYWVRAALWTAVLGLIAWMIALVTVEAPRPAARPAATTETTQTTVAAPVTTTTTRKSTSTTATTTTATRKPTNPRLSPTGTARGFAAAWLSGHDTSDTKSWAHRVQAWTTPEYAEWIPATAVERIPDAKVTHVELVEQGETDATATVTLTNKDRLAVTLTWDGSKWDVSNCEPA